jgi:hypothetical protein
VLKPGSMEVVSLSKQQPRRGHSDRDWGPPRIEGLDDDLWELQEDGSYKHPKYQNLRFVKPEPGRARVIFLGAKGRERLKAQRDKRRHQKG